MSINFDELLQTVRAARAQFGKWATLRRNYERVSASSPDSLNAAFPIESILGMHGMLAEFRELATPLIDWLACYGVDGDTFASFCRNPGDTDAGPATREAIFKTLDQLGGAILREQSRRLKLAPAVKPEAPPTPAPAQAKGTEPGAQTEYGGFCSPSDIAKGMNATKQADNIRKALGKLRDDGKLPEDGWIENGNAKDGQVRYLYKLSTVRPFLARYEAK